ncbi:MAG: signal peptidase II [Acidobacteriota bacterium]
MKGKSVYFALSALLLGADQLTKFWATLSLKPVGSIEVIPRCFRLTYAVNRGVAFSLLADSALDIRWVLAAVSAAAAVMVGGYLVRRSPARRRMNISLSLLLAGIVGNLIDRVRLGEVVDFLDFHWAERLIWPTFNLADAAICCGAALLALELLREEKATGQPAFPASRPAPPAEETSIGSD